jgi:hypothetical protein
MWQGTHYSLKYTRRNTSRSPYLLNKLAENKHNNYYLQRSPLLQRPTLYLGSNAPCRSKFNMNIQTSSTALCCRKVTLQFNTTFGNWKQFAVRGSAEMVVLRSCLIDISSSVYLTAKPSVYHTASGMKWKPPKAFPVEIMIKRNMVLRGIRN